MGAEAVLSNMLEAPAVFEAVLERVFQVTCECLRRWIACCGSHFDILSLWDDFATQRGMLFAPELWRQFLKPRYAELFRAGKEKGLFVWFHSCGDITPVLPDLIDIGMDVWETVQLHALPVPAEALKRDYGRRLTFFGGINTQRLPFARPADVAREVERCIAVLGKGGGYICGPDHRIKLDVPPANTAALFRAATSFRAAGYTVEN
jgi:uroporphyrinogen decarboxylase